MNYLFAYVVVAIGSFIVGWCACLMRISRDPKFVILEENQVVVVKPTGTNILVQVTPEMLRTMTTNKKSGSEMEARSLVKNLSEFNDA
jgi:hypothetical protein